jgi:phosphatidylserine decarboxylase
MKDYPHPIIAVEGIPFVIVLLVASVLVATFYGWWSIPLWLATVFVLQFFRDPPGSCPRAKAWCCAPPTGGDRGGRGARSVSGRRTLAQGQPSYERVQVHSQRSP